jgi:hypothetical protein
MRLPSDEKPLPKITNNVLKSVSQHRREGLEQEVADGRFQNPEGGSSPYVKNANGLTAAGYVKYSKTKTASTASGSGANWHGSGGSVRQVGEVYSPLWLNSNLNLPRDRATINAWARSFYALNPVVHNAINLHSTYPISKLNIRCKDPKKQRFFENMAEECDLENVCCQIAQEFWTLGETFPYAELDETSGKWSRILIQNPDYILVKRSVIAGEPLISLRPDENLARICKSNKPSDVAQRQQLHPSIVEHVRRGENIPLNNFYVSHLARRISPYEIRGTSLIVNCFRSLMLWDKLRESKFAQADNMVNPLTLVKIGGGTDGFKPTPADLELWREVFESAQNDKDFKIFTHDAVTVERIGHNGGILDTANDVTQLMKEIYIGLMIPQVVMDSGDITYANGGVALDVLRSRYIQFRTLISNWLRRKIFAPISKLQDFYEYIDGEKVLIVPEVEWNHMSLFDAGDYINQITQLLSAQPRNVSVQTLYRSLGLEYENEQRHIQKEMVDQIILAKEMEAMQKMNLNELRALGEGDEIQEKKDSPLPGESADDASPDGGGGLPGLDGGPGGGSPPPMPPMPGGPPPGGPPA